MITIVTLIDGKTYDRALAQASSVSGSEAEAKGKVGEAITMGIFSTKTTATTASGKADVTGVSASAVIDALEKSYGTNNPVTASLVEQVKKTMGIGTIDIEAKATGKSIGSGTIKATQATANVTKKDIDYIKRSKALVTELVRLSLINGNRKSKKIADLFDNLIKDLEENSSEVSLTEFRKSIYAAVGGSQGKKLLSEAYTKVMTDKAQFKKFMRGPFGSIIKNKVSNLTVQVNAIADKKKVIFFTTFLGLKYTDSDIKSSKDKDGTYTFSLSSAFEKKLLVQTQRALLKNSLGVITSDINDALSFKISKGSSLAALIGTEKSLKNIVKSLSFTTLNVKVPTGGSIPLGIKVDAGNMFVDITNRVPRILTASIANLGSTQKGRFMSADKMTSLLQILVLDKMKKKGLAAPPIMTNRTGRFVDSLQIAQISYKNRIIRYYSNPVYFTNEQYGYEVSELIEGSIQEIVVSLYSRRFGLIRGQL